MRKTFLPYALPCIGAAEIRGVIDALRSGWITTGPKVQRFEEEFARYIGCHQAIAVNSATGGLHVVLAALDIGPGDEVIVPTMTFCSTAHVVTHVGATPVLVDVDSNCLMTAETVRKAITPNTKAIIPVHYGGQACNMDELLELADRNGIAIVEDAAHAVGCEYRGSKIGTHGRAVAFSFYATKNLATGEGGMITTNDEKLAQRMRILTLHGMSRDAWNRYHDKGSWYYEVVEAGFKYNMTDIQAAIGIPQLRRLDAMNKRRRLIAAQYNEAFAPLEELRLPQELPDRNHVYHLYPIRLDERLTIDRAGFIDALKARKIGASVHFIPLHRHPHFQERYGYGPAEFPIAEQIFSGIVSLPLYPRMTDEDVSDVISAVTEIVQEHRVPTYATHRAQALAANAD
ncbi:MAG: DegT/DnrJ/EryC1/StrS aminotransferase family protein [Acidobacteriia bacterium]|nr:DegT/DnrJ/EryC1/StrS aminotransferase family protein [Terriglobia bacterium]